MAVPCIKLLDDREIGCIHDHSLRLLSTVGVDIGLASVRQLLLDNGARPGKGEMRLLIDEALARRALDSVPADFPIAFLDGRRDSFRAARRFSTCLVDPFMNDAAGNRPPALADCAANARLLDACPKVDMPYKMDLQYADLPTEACVLKSNLALFENFTRHVICAPMTVFDLQTWLEMAEIMAPGPLEGNPVVTVMISPSSPLSLHADVLEMLQCAVRRRAPVICLPCPMCGMTSPVSLAGTLAQLNAENLALIVVCQLLSPGNPMIYHTVAMPGDPTTMAARLTGPEKMMLSLAAAQMGHHYGLPSASTSSSTDVPGFTMQNGAESMGQLFPAALGEADLLTGIGSNSNACGTSGVQIMADLELLRMAERFARGLSFDDFGEVMASVERVGPGGNYLEDEFTLGQFNAEHLFAPQTLSWSGHRGEGDFVANCRARVDHILKTHVPAVDHKRVERLRAYVAEREGR